MDAVVTAVLQSAPQMGLGGLAMTFVVLLLRRESGTEARHQAQLDRISAAHDAELAELREDIRQLRKQVDDLNAALDLERESRRAAEDERDRVRRQGGVT